MAIKSNKKIATVHFDPLSINADIEILSGNTVQVFNREIQEYVPDRTLVPLIMIPRVNCIDPHNVQNGKQELMGVEWYEGSPKSDGSNRIVGDTFYEIGDGTVEGFPKYALKCSKNVDCDKPIEIYAIAIFTDKRRNTEVKVERSKKLYSTYYNSLNYSVKINQPKSWTIDPLTVVPDAEGYWKHTISAQLFSGKTPVADEKAAYWWEIFENGAWRPINDDDCAVWIDCKDAAGNFTKTLTFDARLIDKTASFRVRAAYYEGARPSNPSLEELQDTTNVTLEMTHTLVVDTRQFKGARMDINMTTPVGYEVVLACNTGIIPPEKDHLFQIEWYGKSEKAGGVEKLLGYGRTIEFVPSQLGFSPNYPLSVYANVKMYSGHSQVIIKSSVPGEADSALSVGGVPVIQPVYE